jgi:predicted dehydrogenase
MKIYYPNTFSGEPYIKAPAPIPVESGLVIDVRYAVDVYAALGNITTQRGDLKRELRTVNKLEAIKKFSRLAFDHSLLHARKRVRNRIYRRLQQRYCSFVSVAGYVHAIGSDVKTLAIGDSVAALGFLQPALADFVHVRDSLTVKISNPSDDALRRSCFLFFGSAAAYVQARCLEMHREWKTLPKIRTVGTGLWIDITKALLEEHQYEITGQDDCRQKRTNASMADGAFSSNTQGCFVERPSNLSGRSRDSTHFWFARDSESSGDRDTEVTLPLPDPWTGDNLNVQSKSSFQLPAWLGREYMEAYISFAEKDRARFVNTQYLHSYISVKKEFSPVQVLRQVPVEKPKIGSAIIGIGAFGTELLCRLIKIRALQMRTAIDRNPYNAWLAAETFDCGLCSSDIDAALNDPNILVVFIATHHASHAPLAVMSLQKGKSVYLEKPHVVSYEQLSTLMEAATEKPGRLQVGFNRRYAPAILEAKNSLSLRTTPLNITFVCRLHHIPPNSFYYWPEQGSRVISNLCHHLDLAYYLIGTTPRAVSAVSSLVGRKDENVAVTALFTDGSMCTILYTDRGDSSLPGDETIRMMMGSTTIDVTNYSSLQVRNNGRVVKQWKGDRDFGHQKCLEEFVSCVGEGRSVPYSVDDIYWSALLFLTADKALKTGRVEEIPTEPVPLTCRG